MKTALIVFACAIAFTKAASHDVEWIYGMTENELCVAPGDIVNFIWETNHNVDPVATKEDYDNCVFSNTEAEAGPLAWTAPAEEGITYVVCGVSVHCTSGNQKLAITVSNSC